MRQEYLSPTLTRVELRIDEAVLGNCKATSDLSFPVVQFWGLSGCGLDFPTMEVACKFVGS